MANYVPVWRPPRIVRPKKRLRHRTFLGGNQGSAKKEVTYYILPELVEYVSGLGPQSPGVDAETPTGRVNAIDEQE